jgi:hypothetical protein
LVAALAAASQIPAGLMIFIIESFVKAVYLTKSVAVEKLFLVSLRPFGKLRVNSA